jgi:glutathione S-transferase
MKLYYSPGACSLADHAALIAAGIPHETEKVDLKVKITETGKDYRSINPKGYVPALELDNGQVLTENIAILLYIAHTSHKLLPQGDDMWRVIEMLAYISTEVHKTFKPLFDPQADPDLKARAKQALGQRLDFLETRLGPREFIIGNELTIADCYLFVMLCWCRRLDIHVPTQLLVYFHRMELVPAISEAIAKEGLR